MADRNAPPVFLERRSYRKRRMMDAVRLMPFLGALLWMVPLLWSEDQGRELQATHLSTAIKYVFWVWLGLIVASALLWRLTGTEAAAPDAGEGDS